MLPDREARAWILETLGWLARVHGGRLPAPRPLLLPNDAFFPVRRDLAPEARSRALFRHLQQHVGLPDMRCEIAAQPAYEPAPGDLPLVCVPVAPEPAAIFRRSFGGSAPHRIHYHPELHEDPTRLLAILAHGLAHAVLCERPGEPPGGADAFDCATDLAALWLGAGVFLANAALVVRREERLFFEGLEVRCQGWLGQGDFAFALAVFCRVYRHPLALARAHLRRGPRLELDAAAAGLARGEHADALRVLEAERSV